MSGNSTVCKFMTIVFIICAIVAPVFTGEPLDKPSAIEFLICISIWIIAGFIADIKDSSELESKINELESKTKLLENRIKELEDKNK